jgi:hypothetical protein
LNAPLAQYAEQGTGSFNARRHAKTTLYTSEVVVTLNIDRLKHINVM